LLLTLKLTKWSLAEQLPEWILRVRSWGYNIVRPRQLVHNRQEVCIAALMKPFRRKPPR
jgi:23S rRNA (cytidine2498-2'-O)-methyltransferase